MSIKNLIDAIESGSAVDTEAAFGQIMAEKISARMEDMRVSVAQNMFATEEVELDEVSLNTANAAYQKRLKQGHTATDDDTEDKNFEKAYDTKERVKKKFGKAGEKHLEKSEPAYDSYRKEEFTLEDFSAEEIEEFMVSEDYEQLDELSKDTLARYVHAAGRDKEERTRHGADLRKADDDLGNASFAASSRHVTNPKTRADAQNAISAARSEVSKKINDNDDKKYKRGVGIRKALKKLSK